MMDTQIHICGICEIADRRSVCAACLNLNLSEKYKLLNALQLDRDSLHKRLDEKLQANRKSVEQQRWRSIHAEKISRLKQTLRLKTKQFFQEKSELEEKTKELNTKKGLLDEAYAVLQRNKTEQLKLLSDLTYTQRSCLTAIRKELLQSQSVRIKQLSDIFPLSRVYKRNEGENRDQESSGEHCYDQICKVSLPRGLNPISVTPKELAVSLGYMVQLLNLAVRYLYAPLLLESGFAGSFSRVWQRASYWNDRPAASQYNLLFLPSHKYSEDGSKLECSSNVRGCLCTKDVYTKDVQKGIHLLKKAVACVTAYCFNSLSIPLPSEQLSTFEAFAKILTLISNLSSKDNEATMSRHRSQGQQNPMTGTFFDSNEIAYLRRAEADFDGWHFVEDTQSPPP